MPDETESVRPLIGEDPEAWNAAAAAIPQEWEDAACDHYSMHGNGLVRNILAGVEPLIRAAERERILARAFACRHCNQAHERIYEDVPTWGGGYQLALGADGHRFSSRFDEYVWGPALTELLGEGDPR